MPEYFKRHGYLAYASGKLYHPDKPPNNDFPASWTEDKTNPYYWGNGAPIGDQDRCPNVSNADINVPIADAGWRIEPYPGSPSYGVSCTLVNDTAALDDADPRDTPQPNQTCEYDHRVVNRALEFMAHAASQKAPFFIGTGLRKPHIPWRVPHRFWDAYRGESIKLAKVQSLGEGVPELAYEMNGPMSQIWVDPRGGRHRESSYGPPLPASLQASIRRGYYAAVSFLDFEVGRLLDGLDRLGLAEMTAVLFHSDHGWKLGEHGAWSKCTNWELDARVPLIVRAPWLGPAARGTASMALAELVDLYPTLVGLSGLPQPPASEGIEGTSLVPALLRPDAVNATGKLVSCRVVRAGGANQPNYRK
jgi:iduronate 2-sulfatase